MESNNQSVDPESLLTELSISDPNRYFAMIPYLVSDMPLGVYAKALYLHIVRRCGGGNNGSCYESSENMAKRLHIAKGSVIKAKRELVDVGLIKITKKPATHGEFSNDLITLIKIWPENESFYSLDLGTGKREELLAQQGKYILAFLHDILSGEERN